MLDSTLRDAKNPVCLAVVRAETAKSNIMRGCAKTFIQHNFANTCLFLTKNSSNESPDQGASDKHLLAVRESVYQALSAPEYRFQKMPFFAVRNEMEDSDITSNITSGSHGFFRHETIVTFFRKSNFQNIAYNTMTLAPSHGH